MNPPEQNDPAWELLLKARKVEPSPFFARNVVREVRNLGETASGPSWREWFTVPRLVTAAACLVIGGFLVMQFTGTGDDIADARAVAIAAEVPQGTLLDIVPEAEDLTAEEFADELEMIDYMDGLIAVQDIEMLDDAALADLLF